MSGILEQVPRGAPDNWADLLALQMRIQELETKLRKTNDNLEFWQRLAKMLLARALPDTTPSGFS